MEPTSFRVKEESSLKNKAADFVDTKLLTRLTYTLDAVRAVFLGPSQPWPYVARTLAPMHPPLSLPPSYLPTSPLPPYVPR